MFVFEIYRFVADNDNDDDDDDDIVGKKKENDEIGDMYLIIWIILSGSCLSIVMPIIICLYRSCAQIF